MEAIRFQNERELINDLKAGDAAAWENVINACHTKLSFDIGNSLAKRNLSEELLNDILQQTWLIAMETMAKGEFEYTADGKLYNWLRSTSLMIIYTTQKDKAWDPPSGNESEHQEMLEYILDKLGIYQQSPEEEHILHEQAARIMELIHTGLSPRDQKIIMRHFFMGEDRHSIASSYRIQPESVTRIIMRARKTLETHVVAQQLFHSPEPVERY